MTDARAQVTTEVLQAFADAWNRHDVDALMSFMTEDCVFEASAGPDVCGARYEGQQDVRAAFVRYGQRFPTRIGAVHAILSVGSGEYQNGHSREHGLTVRKSKSMAAMCSLFSAERSL